MDHPTPDAVPSKAAIAGHPIHPMLIPFPIAFLAGAWLTDVVFWLVKDPFWANVSFWLIVGGLVSGLLAGIIGAVDFAALREARAHKSGWIHALGNVAALLLAAANVIFRSGNTVESVLPTGLILSTLTAALLVVTGWAGGELSYRHRIGVTARKEIPTLPRR